MYLAAGWSGVWLPIAWHHVIELARWLVLGSRSGRIRIIFSDLDLQLEGIDQDLDP
jgi:hypothetical protein